MTSSSFRAILRRDVLALCAFIFFADVLAGLIIPTFSIYAEGLGASWTFIGLLSSVVGITSLFVALPLGILSDRLGRKRLLLTGMMVWALALFSFSVATHPYLLLPGRVLMGIAGILTFATGAALLGDLTKGSERGPAFGLYATAMGLGFAVGPIIGGRVSGTYGIGVSYQVGVLIAISGLLIGWRFLPSNTPSLSKSGDKDRSSPSARNMLSAVLRNPFILIGCTVFLVHTMAFSGAIQNFFPLYANQSMIATTAVATMFAVRAFMSTGARLPVGLLAGRVSPGAVLTLCLGIMAIGLAGISMTTSQGLLMFFLAIEGIGFGGIVAAGQAYIAEHSDDSTRGTAMGVYQLSGAIGATVGPLVLGLIADRWGLAVVFQVTSVMVLVGLVFAGSAVYREIVRAKRREDALVVK